MKKLIIVSLFVLLSLSVQASSGKGYKLITISTYLNFYLLNLNACEDYHPSIRMAAYRAEGKLHPYFAKLEAKISKLEMSKKEQEAINRTVSSRREKLNQQIKEGELTLEHCAAIISIVKDGLDSTLLKVID